jgi:hypothetical protein
MIDVLYVRLDENGYTEIVRAKIFRHQNRLIIAEYILPAKMFDQQKVVQAFSINSFNFTNEYEIDAQEKIVPLRLNGLYLEYPRSWRLRILETDAINRHEFSLDGIDANQFVFAALNGALISNKSLRDRLDKTVYPVNLKEELEIIKQKTEEKGFVIEDPLEAHRFKNNFTTQFAAVEVYPLRRELNSVFVVEEQNPVSHELWLAVIRTPKIIGKNYVFSMITPSREQNYSQWAYAVDAFRFIVESVN